MDFRIRIAEGQDEQPTLLPDTIWNPQAGQADWSLFDADESRNIGGLRSKEALHTAVLLCLFTDRRCPGDHPLRTLMDSDPRGWWGDGFDIRSEYGETEMGSLLWLLERAPLTEEMRRWAESLAIEALQPLIGQGAVVKVEAAATMNAAVGRLELVVNLYGRDGLRLYEQKFEDLWNQLSAA